MKRSDTPGDREAAPGARQRSQSRDSKGSKGQGKGKGKEKGKDGGKRGRSPSPPNAKPFMSNDPKKVCKFCLKGQCSKSHAECDFVHNPTCWYFKTKGKCRDGDKCLFPHRGEGAFLVTKIDHPADATADADAADAGGADNPAQEALGEWKEVQATRKAKPKKSTTYRTDGKACVLRATATAPAPSELTSTGRPGATVAVSTE